MKRIIFLLFLFQIFSVTTILASDNIVINEFLPNPTSGNDWVELYNPTNSGIDVSAWVLRDTASSVMATIPSGTLIVSHGFYLQDVSDRLNISADTIYLRLSSSSSENIDTKSYSINPGTGVSIGRSPNGEDNWVTFNNPTPGSSNNPSSPTPTATPTVIPTVTPTPTITPTYGPTTAPTPTVVPTIIPTTSPGPSLFPTPTSINAPLTPPFNIHEILEKRMQCRFSYSRFAKLPNGAILIEVLKNFFGKNSVCSP